MSLVTTSTATVAASAGAGAIIAPAVLVAGAAALGYALTRAPFWKDIEHTISVPEATSSSFFGVNSLQTDLLAKAEKYYDRLLQLPESEIPPLAMGTIAGVMAVKDSPLIAATIHEQYKDQFDMVLNKLARIENLSRPEVQELDAQASLVIESALEDVQRRVTSFIAEQLKAAAKDVGYAIKEEANGPGGLAFIAVNHDGQTLAAHLDAKGTVTTDMAGFSGRRCERAINDLHGALEKRGIRLNHKKDQPHYLFKGGALLQTGPKAQQILANAEMNERKRQRSPQAAGGSSRDRIKRAHLLNRLRHSH